MSTYSTLLVGDDDRPPRVLPPVDGTFDTPRLDASADLNIKAESGASHESAATWFTALAEAATAIAEWHGRRCGAEPGSGG